MDGAAAEIIRSGNDALCSAILRSGSAPENQNVAGLYLI